MGKSTLLRHIQGDKRAYVNLDDIRYRRLAVQDPVGFLDSVGTPVFIDEFHVRLIFCLRSSAVWTLKH